MAQIMSEDNGDEADSEADSDADETRTTVRVDRDVWRQLRSDAVAEGKTISEKLEEILIEHFGLEGDADDNESNTDDRD